MKRVADAAAGRLDAALDQAAGLHQAGQLDEAEAAYRPLLKGSATQRRSVLQLLALLYRQQGRADAALATYDQLLVLGVRTAEVFLVRGDLLQGLARPAEALQSYDRALQHDPRSPEALNNRAAALIALRRLDEALASCEAALAVRPAYAEALFNHGLALDAAGRSAAALERYDGALEIAPDHPQALNNRALLLSGEKRHAEALEGYDRALAVDPGYADAWNNRSACLRALGRFDAALQSADQALAARPDFPEAFNSRGLALAALMRFDAALDSYGRALALRPAYPEALSNAGLALVALGDPEAALQRYEAALALAPGFADAEFNSGLTLLRLHRFDQGWARHEARWRRPGAAPSFPPDRLWLGGETLPGRTLLLHAEQGLGDTLQFCRFAPAIAEASGARVMLQVQPPLVRLLQGLDGVADCVALGAPVPDADRHIPLMSLPLALAASTGPAGGYLTAEADKVQAWRRRLGVGGRLRVGLAWAGNPAHENDHNRSLPVSGLAPLLECEVDWVSLQKDATASDRAWLQAAGAQGLFAPELYDFSDTAALIMACDLVVAVDTAVAHLAGALGRPVWILTPRLSDWRWGAPSADQDVYAFERTPWYASARLYRQRRFGDWLEVVYRIRDALTAEAAGSPRRPPFTA